MWIATQTFSLLCLPTLKKGFVRKQKKWPKMVFLQEKNRRMYLWISLPSLFFVICQGMLRVGSSPGWEISKPCFLTSLIYLEIFKNREDVWVLGLFVLWIKLVRLTLLHQNARLQGLRPIWRCSRMVQQCQDAETSSRTTFYNTCILSSRQSNTTS